MKNSQRRRVVTPEEKPAPSRLHPSYAEVVLKSDTKSPERWKEKDVEKLVGKNKMGKEALGEGERRKLGINYEILQNSPSIFEKSHIGPSNCGKFQNDPSTSKKLQVGQSTSAKCQIGPSTSRILQNGPSTSKKLQLSPSGSKNFRFSQSIYTKTEFDPIRCENQFKALEDDPVVCKIGKSCVVKEREWIFYCGATYTMTYDKSDLMMWSKSARTHVQTASGELTPVQGAGTIEISPTLKVSNCLYVPSLSHKLLSVSHVTKELNCTLLIHPSFCLLQDIRTGEIIGCGTERQGLYYVDEITQTGTAMLTHGAANRESWL